MYQYCLGDSVNLYDPDGLAWEPTASQGYHYNDRKTGFGFKLEVDEGGNFCAVPLKGHTFEQNKANKILRKAMSNETVWKHMVAEMEHMHKAPGYKDKNYTGKLLKAAKGAGYVASAILVVMAVEELRVSMEPITRKMRCGEILTDNDVFTFLIAVDQSAVINKELIALEFMNSYWFK